ncbi:PREDICTED: uncharacterized protein LOC108359319 [Rhagoletis zephyria]|uniref:uncharacterized protein LOC108359319 n=1 Tax=Rhagoletis zephyria TaxID=28612 RepID=UPI0008119C22|nr:PREDICTED: uncharacterized protein LOC108359319 [Rhagoletis zephyria]
MTGGTSQTNQAENVQIRRIELSDHDEVLQFLRKHYYLEEPLTIGSEPKEQDPEDEKFNMSQLANGTCLMAVIESGGGEKRKRIAGVLISGPKDSSEAAHLFEEVARLGSNKWGRTLKLLACIERDSNVYERYNVAKALHVHIVAVDSAIRGRAIGARLIEEEKKLGRQLGYPLLTIDCTSYYSAKMSDRLGMDCVNVVKYESYLDRQGKPVFTPPSPHDCVKTFATRL